ncbi:MAG: DUF4190 domain-containing protein [Marmoricola sp.]
MSYDAPPRRLPRRRPLTARLPRRLRCQYGQPYGAAPTGGTNQKALWAMILGILSLCCGFLLGIPAIILGVIGGKEIAASGGMQQGEGMAKAGLILGVIGTVIGIGWLVFRIGGAMQGIG